MHVQGDGQYILVPNGLVVVVAALTLVVQI
jgi:hypothetical protein